MLGELLQVRGIDGLVAKPLPDRDQRPILGRDVDDVVDIAGPVGSPPVGGAEKARDAAGVAGIGAILREDVVVQRVPVEIEQPGRTVAAIGQTGDDRAAGKALRVVRQQHRAHGAPCRKTHHIDAGRVGTFVRQGPVDHLQDRGALPGAGPVVFVVMPAKAPALHVGLALLWQQEQRAQIVGQRGEAGLVVEALGVHQAAMQRDDQGRRRARPVRAIEKAVERAGIVTEIAQRFEREGRALQQRKRA